MDKKLKAAVIGCGGAGITNHIPWYARHKDVALVGLVDADISRAQDCAEEWSGRVYDDIQKMLERERPDIVSIATPVNLHTEQAIRCMSYGCAVLCEKPMAPTIEECQKMIDCAKTNKVILGIVFDKRFSIVSQKMREVIIAGQIGRPLSVRVNWGANCIDIWRGSFRTKLSTGGGVFQDVGSHFIDLLSWLVDSEISMVEGAIDICFPDIFEIEDNAAAILKFKSGIIGTIETNWIGGPDFSKSPYQHEWVWVYGTDGIVKGEGSLRLEPPPVELFDRKTGQWRTLRLRTNSVTLEHYQYKRLIDEFISCVLEKKQFVPSGEDGKKAIEIVLALYQSSHTGKKISLPLVQSPDLKEIFTTLRQQKLQRDTAPIK